MTTVFFAAPVMRTVARIEQPDASLCRWSWQLLSHYPLNGLVYVLAGFSFGRFAAGVI